MLSIRSQIKKALDTYNKIAALYAKYNGDKLLQYQLTKFSSYLPSKGKILDAGCGPGRDSVYFREDGFDVTAIDLSDAMIAEAQKQSVTVLKMNMMDLQFAEKSFDGIWCMASLSDIEKKDAPLVLQQFHKVLKEKGTIYLAVREGDGEHIVEKEAYGGLPRFYALYRCDELKQLLLESSFDILEAKVSSDEGQPWVEIFARKK